MDYTMTRRIPIEEGYDLVVAGGGPAGCAAAICAARLGVKVLLAETMGSLGGMGTSGLVAAFDPMADGERMLVGGYMRELIEEMFKRGFLKPGINPDAWRKSYMVWIPFHPEGLKLVLDQWCRESGVDVRFFCKVIDADVDAGKTEIRGVVLHQAEGYRYIKAKTFIDCTGDAVLASLCGAECLEAGRDTANIMPPTLCSLHANINWENDTTCHAHEEDGLARPTSRWRNIQKEALILAIEKNHFTIPNRHIAGGLVRIGETIGYMNTGHEYKTDALNCHSLSQAMMLGRRLAREYLEFYRTYIPGCEQMEIVTTAALLGVRESRRIVGEYKLSIEDYLARRQFPDQIGIFNKFVDTHPYDSSLEEWQRFQQEKTRDCLRQGECFGIPYSILVPRGWSNLWVAGRCNSSDLKVHGAIRVMPAAAMMGQAAGTAAVQSLRTGQPANDLDTEQLVLTLRENGANLPQENLSKNMTR